VSVRGGSNLPNGVRCDCEEVQGKCENETKGHSHLTEKLYGWKLLSPKLTSLWANFEKGHTERGVTLNGGKEVLVEQEQGEGHSINAPRRPLKIGGNFRQEKIQFQNGEKISPGKGSLEKKT